MEAAMKPALERSSAFLHAPIGSAPRTALIVAAILVVAAHFFALWNLTMFAPQYSHGLRIDIYDRALVGGHDGLDIKEINLLNHYIGMRDLAPEDFTEFMWMPFALGGLALLFLRGAVLGTVKELVDATMVFVYFSGFSLWSFVSKLYRYGHELSPTAPVKVPGFMPPVFGYRQIANFEVYSYPQAGSYLLASAALVLAVAIWIAWRQRPRLV
jgi:hypothetical protein